VRSFPSAAGKRLLATLVLTATLAAAAVPVSVAAERDDLKDKQKDVHQQVQQAQAEVAEASRAVTRAERALSAAKGELKSARSTLYAARAHVAGVRAQLKVARAEDARMQGLLEQAQAALDQAVADVKAGQAALDAQRQQVKSTVVALYQQGSPQLLAWSGYLHSQTPADLTRKLEYADTLVEDQHAEFEQLHAAEVALREKRAQVKEAEEKVAAQRAEAAEQFRATQALRDEAVRAKEQARVAKEDVTATVAARTKARRAAARAKARDEAELARLKKQEQKIKQQILAAAAQDHSHGYVGNADGLLLAPVSGPVTSPFGYRIHPIYGYYGLHDGTDFGVGCGQSMRAVANGKVISRYYSSVYGNRLYLNVGKVNGHNITAVYNHASGYRVSVGQSVKRGETVRYVGSTGWSTGCHLHFTVLQDGNAVNPMNYL